LLPLAWEGGGEIEMFRADTRRKPTEPREKISHEFRSRGEKRGTRGKGAN